MAQAVSMGSFCSRRQTRVRSPKRNSIWERWELDSPREAAEGEVARPWRPGRCELDGIQLVLIAEGDDEEAAEEAEEELLRRARRRRERRNRARELD